MEKRVGVAWNDVVCEGKISIHIEFYEQIKIITTMRFVYYPLFPTFNMFIIIIINSSFGVLRKRVINNA